MGSSGQLYRRFEASAYIPVIGNENTHAEISVSYLRRTEDNFYGIGPRFPKDFQTNFDIEQRAINATLYHHFANGLQAGVYAQRRVQGNHLIYTNGGLTLEEPVLRQPGGYTSGSVPFPITTARVADRSNSRSR